MRMFSVADQRSIPEVDGRHGDRRAVPRAAADRRRPRSRRRARRATSRRRQPSRRHRGDMLAKLAEGIPVDGMEALLPVLRPAELSLLTDHLPARTPRADLRPGEGPHPRGRPDQDRPRVPRGVVVVGRRSAATRRSTSSRSARRASASSTTSRAGARAGGHPWWTLSQLGDESAHRTRHPAGAVGPRASRSSVDEIFAMLRAHVVTGGVGRGRHAGHRHRAPRRRAARRSRHSRSDVGARRRTEGRRRRRAARVRCTTVSCCRAPTWSSSPRPT